MNLNGCINSEIDANIVLYYQKFDTIFYVSDKLTIKGLIFDGSNPFYTKKLISSSGGFFEMDPINDDLNDPSIPQISFTNLKFQFFNLFQEIIDKFNSKHCLWQHIYGIYYNK